MVCSRWIPAQTLALLLLIYQAQQQQCCLHKYQLCYLITQMKKPVRTPLSQSQLDDAKRLQAIYKKRVKESRERGDSPILNQAELGEKCGWKSGQSTVSQYMTGRVALNLEALVKLAEQLQFEPSEVSPTLASGIRRASHTDGVKEPDREAANAPFPDRLDVAGLSEERYALVPQYDAKAAAGLGSENPHVEIRATLAFKRDWLKAKGVSPKSLAVIYADGESMEPTISNGDVLLVDLSKIEPEDHQIFVLAGTEGVIVKRLVSCHFGRWIIRSDNEDKDQYPDRNMSREDSNEHRIIGKVIWRGG
ncbi:LexA family transcriptional regulator, partial [Pseudomonas aeruginosa]